jgi:hypothetical protein
MLKHEVFHVWPYSHNYRTMFTWSVTGWVGPYKRHNLPSLYQPNNQYNKTFESHSPTKKKKRKMAIRIVFIELGDNERVMRSAEEASPDATELKVLVLVIWGWV